MQRILYGDAASFLCGLVGERQPQRDPVLCTDRAGDMPFAGQVFSKLDMTRLEGDLLASSSFDFSTAAECDDVLPLRRRMPILHRTCRGAVKLGPRDLHQLCDIAA